MANFLEEPNCTDGLKKTVRALSARTGPGGTDLVPARERAALPRGAGLFGPLRALSLSLFRSLPELCSLAPSAPPLRGRARPGPPPAGLSL